MNSDNIGKFIKQLREEFGLTQEELANKVHIGREAVSKWERGKTSPDSSVLLILSDIFNVSVNEILIGERKTEKNATLELYQDRNKLLKKFKKVFFVGCGIIFIFLVSFLTYYFINQYKSIHAYTISGFGKNFDIIDGLFVKTNGKIYFNLGNIKNLNDWEIEYLELYYIDNDVKNVICGTDDNILSFVDYKGYEEYFDLSKIEFIKNNLYLSIKYNDETEIIRLTLLEDYVNDDFLFINDRKITNDYKTQINEKTSKELIDKIKNKFTKNKVGYAYEISEKEKEIQLNYVVDNSLLIVTILDNNKINEEYYFDLNYLTLSFESYVENYNFSSDLLNESVDEKEERKIEEFINIINKI